MEENHNDLLASSGNTIRPAKRAILRTTDPATKWLARAALASAITVDVEAWLRGEISVLSLPYGWDIEFVDPYEDIYRHKIVAPRYSCGPENLVQG
jgi:hypothetical protein